MHKYESFVDVFAVSVKSVGKMKLSIMSPILFQTGHFLATFIMPATMFKVFREKKGKVT